MTGTSNIGLTAVDPRWSNYGVYLQRLIEAVQVQWERIQNANGIHPDSPCQVEVKFVVNSHGEISKIVDVNLSAGTAAAAAKACISAIQARATYGEWTDDMIAKLGSEQEMTFSFLYQ